MLRFHRNFAILAALAMVATLVTGSIARADIIVSFSEDGGSVTTIPVATGLPTATGVPPGVTYAPGGTLTFGDFSITGVSLGETQTSTLSEVLSATFSITNSNLLTAGLHSLTATIEATNFTLPTAPPGILVAETLSGTTPASGHGAGAGNVISFSSMVDAQSSAPTLTPDITGSTSFYGANGTQIIATGVPASPPYYAVLQTFTVTLNPTANLQVTARTDLSAVPEPASVAMALTGLPILGLLWTLRRRRA